MLYIVELCKGDFELTIRILAILLVAIIGTVFTRNIIKKYFDLDLFKFYE